MTLEHEDAKDEFHNVIRLNIERHDETDIANNSVPEMIALHNKLYQDSQDYKSVFNRYARLARSPAVAELEDRLYLADQAYNRGAVVKSFFMAASVFIRHLPTVAAMHICEKKIDKIFDENYQPS